VYAIYAKVGNIVVNSILLSLVVFYTLFELITKNKNIKHIKKIVRRSYKSIKFLTKTFSLGIMIYGIYVASTNVSGISIILATLMIILWVLQLLLELVVEIFDDKKDLIVAGWNKDIENLKKPVTKVNNFIKKFRGEEIVEEICDSKELKLLEKKINENKKVKV